MKEEKEWKMEAKMWNEEEEKEKKANQAYYKYSNEEMKKNVWKKKGERMEKGEI